MATITIIGNKRGLEDVNGSLPELKRQVSLPNGCCNYCKDTFPNLIRCINKCCSYSLCRGCFEFMIVSNPCSSRCLGCETRYTLSHITKSASVEFYNNIIIPKINGMLMNNKILNFPLRKIPPKEYKIYKECVDEYITVKINIAKIETRYKEYSKLSESYNEGADMESILNRLEKIEESYKAITKHKRYIIINICDKYNIYIDALCNKKKNKRETLDKMGIIICPYCDNDGYVEPYIGICVNCKIKICPLCYSHGNNVDHDCIAGKVVLSRNYRHCNVCHERIYKPKNIIGDTVSCGYCMAKISWSKNIVTCINKTNPYYIDIITNRTVILDEELKLNTNNIVPKLESIRSCADKILSNPVKLLEQCMGFLSEEENGFSLGENRASNFVLDPSTRRKLYISTMSIILIMFYDIYSEKHNMLVYLYKRKMKFNGTCPSVKKYGNFINIIKNYLFIKNKTIPIIKQTCTVLSDYTDNYIKYKDPLTDQRKNTIGIYSKYAKCSFNKNILELLDIVLLYLSNTINSICKMMLDIKNLYISDKLDEIELYRIIAGGNIYLKDNFDERRQSINIELDKYSTHIYNMNKYWNEKKIEMANLVNYVNYQVYLLSTVYRQNTAYIFNCDFSMKNNAKSIDLIRRDITSEQINEILNPYQNIQEKNFIADEIPKIE